MPYNVALSSAKKNLLFLWRGMRNPIPTNYKIIINGYKGLDVDIPSKSGPHSQLSYSLFVINWHEHQRSSPMLCNSD